MCNNKKIGTSTQRSGHVSRNQSREAMVENTIDQCPLKKSLSNVVPIVSSRDWSSVTTSKSINCIIQKPQTFVIPDHLGSDDSCSSISKNASPTTIQTKLGVENMCPELLYLVSKDLQAHKVDNIDDTLYDKESQNTSMISSSIFADKTEETPMNQYSKIMLPPESTSSLGSNANNKELQTEKVVSLSERLATASIPNSRKAVERNEELLLGRLNSLSLSNSRPVSRYVRGRTASRPSSTCESQGRKALDNVPPILSTGPNSGASLSGTERNKSKRSRNTLYKLRSAGKSRRILKKATKETMCCSIERNDPERLLSYKESETMSSNDVNIGLLHHSSTSISVKNKLHQNGGTNESSRREKISFTESKKNALLFSKPLDGGVPTDYNKSGHSKKPLQSSGAAASTKSEKRDASERIHGTNANLLLDEAGSRLHLQGVPITTSEEAKALPYLSRSKSQSVSRKQDKSAVISQSSSRSQPRSICPKIQVGASTSRPQLQHASLITKKDVSTSQCSVNNLKESRRVLATESLNQKSRERNKEQISSYASASKLLGEPLKTSEPLSAKKSLSSQHSCTSKKQPVTSKSTCFGNHTPELIANASKKDHDKQNCYNKENVESIYKTSKSLTVKGVSWGTSTNSVKDEKGVVMLYKQQLYSDHSVTSSDVADFLSKMKLPIDASKEAEPQSTNANRKNQTITSCKTSYLEKYRRHFAGLVSTTFDGRTLLPNRCRISTFNFLLRYRNRINPNMYFCLKICVSTLLFLHGKCTTEFIIKHFFYT